MSDGDFKGRETELQYLNGLWDSDGLVTCSVWGRRRIGKSRLLREFSKGKRTIYLQAIQGSYYENLSTLSMDISSFCGRDIGRVEDLSHLMGIIERLCSEEHTLVIIDELPYLIDSAPQAASVIQKSIDRGFDGVDCMFVVCGSSISTMRRETESYDRPLYGRFTNVLQVKQIDLKGSMDFHPEMDVYTALRWYTTVGGIPQYLKAAQNGTYESNLTRLFFGPESPWRDDAPQTILQEFKGNHNYTGIVKCIADGSVKQSEIADRLGIDRAACKRMLDDLESIGVVERRHPMMNAPKRPVYRIADPFISFHYDIISKNSMLIDTSESPSSTYRLLKNKIDSHLGHVFETVCARWICDHLTIIEIGSWWGRDSEGVDVDIDIIAKVFDDDITYTLVCECKFSKNPMGFTALNVLEQRCKDALIKENVRYALFSAGGFQDDLREYADENGIMLIDCETIMGLKNAPPISFRNGRRS